MDYQAAWNTMKQAMFEAQRLRPTQVHERIYVLARQRIRMCVVGDALAEYIHQAFAHVESHAADDTNDADTRPVSLTIEVYEQSEAGRKMRATLSQFASRVGTRYSHDQRFVLNVLEHSMTCLDRWQQHLIGFTPDVESLSLYERGRTFHVPLTVWHNDRLVPVIHAGLVAHSGAGVLLAGASGAGKSTTVVTCLCAGFTYLSDDLVGVHVLEDGTSVGHSLYNSTYVEPCHLARFPLLLPHAMKSQYSVEEKLLVLLFQIFPERFACSVPIQAVALPRVIDAEQTQFYPASKDEALFTLSVSSLPIGKPCVAYRGFDVMAKLVATMPCYRLEIGRDLSDIPVRVKEMLE